MFERTEKAFGRVDIVHNNAIWFRHGSATELDEKDWDGTLNIGLKAIFLAAKYGIPVMRKTGGGVIINTGSVHSLVSFATATAYDSAKAGVLGLTRTLAIDYGPDIRVCAVLPGAILTPLWDDLKVPKKERRRYAKMVPANRLGTGEDIANAVLFLVSDEASFITGTSLTVDGGMLARTE
jgi:NAD(P)-dependent dehydrogenase (short-subunit alcohol dehydrogenase family)